MAELKRERAGSELILGEIQGWLSACDLVKFAKVSPTRRRGARRAGDARSGSSTPPGRRRRRGRAGRGAGRRRHGGAACAEAPERAPSARARSPTALIAAVFVPLRRPTLLLLRNVEGFRFAHPWLLVLIPLAVALVLWVGLGARAGAGAALFVLLARRRARRAAAAGWSRGCAICRRCCGWRRWCWWGWRWRARRRTRASDDLELEGIDIVIALDLSGSMQETDLVPNRLDAAKTVIQDFVRRRPDRSHRPGGVRRARPTPTSPLTLDHGTLPAHAGASCSSGSSTERHAIGNGARRRAEPAAASRTRKLAR